jgi:hypothetical protein
MEDSMKNRRFSPRLLLVTTALVSVVATGWADPLPPLPEGAFSIVAIPDTQQYASSSPETFEALMHWILDNQEAQQIKFVSQVGDIVDKNSDPDQWEVARRSMMMLHGKVPFAIAPGNHDMVTSNGDSSNFQKAFPASLFEEFDWYGGSLKDNANSWQTFSAGGMDFLIVHVECNAPDEVLAWVDGVLTDHPKHRAIVTTHMYLGPHEKPRESKDYYEAAKGRMVWKKCHGKAGNTPQEMWEKCFSKHPNVFMILAGDQSRTQSMYQRAEGANGNTVHELMSDYREGYLRVYRFLPDANALEVFTYSPTLGKLCDGTDRVPDRKNHQFTLEWPAVSERASAAAASATP